MFLVQISFLFFIYVIFEKLKYVSLVLNHFINLTYCQFSNNTLHERKGAKLSEGMESTGGLSMASLGSALSNGR